MTTCEEQTGLFRSRMVVCTIAMYGSSLCAIPATVISEKQIIACEEQTGLSRRHTYNSCVVHLCCSGDMMCTIAAWCICAAQET